MSTIQVANIAFEATENNQISYTDQKVSILAGGVNAFSSNSSSLLINKVTGNYALAVTASNNSYTLASNTSVANLTTNGAVIFSGIVTPTQLTSNTSDWNPSIANAFFVRTSSSANVVIYGIVEGANGQLIVLNNIGNNNITLASEDAVNENTATRRFNLPDNITLYPNNSISLIYDGISQRWKTQKSLGTKFFHKSSLTKGFFSGGTTTSPTVVNTADRTTYSTEATAAVTGANLSQARLGAAGAGNAFKAFIVGGSDGGAVPLTVYYATADRTTYATEATAAVTGSNLSAVRRYSGGAGNACKGFFIGGGAAGALATADRTTYATETTSAIPSANLPTARNRVSAVGNSCKSFNSGGEGVVATSDRTNHSTEITSAVPGANLTQARDHTGSAGSGDKGFFMGGRSPTIVATADRTTYATETTAAVPGANLSAAKSSFSGTGNGCKGFFAGGINPVTVATTDRTTYSTETTAAVPGADLSQARSLMAAI